jgi:hypothetical protein
VRQWAEIENRSSQEVKINPPPCLAVNVSARSPAAIWWVNRGGNDASKQGGTFTEPVVKDMSKSLPLGQDGANPIPWMAVQAGADRGLYAGWEYSGKGHLDARTGTEDATLELRFTLAEKQLPKSRPYLSSSSAMRRRSIQKLKATRSGVSKLMMRSTRSREVSVIGRSSLW